MPSEAGLTLQTPLRQLWGVGPERETQLARLGLHTLGDLLLHRPRRYEDRRHLLAIRDLKPGEPAATRGRVVAQGLKTFRNSPRCLFELIIDDGTGRLHCHWWNLPFMEKYFAAGDDVMVFGRLASLKPRTMDHPETEVVEEGDEASIHMDRVVPVYPLTDGLPQRWLRSLVWRAVGLCERLIVEPWPELASEFHPPGPALHDPPSGLGRDGFHSVPGILGQDGDAVERVPTGFKVATRLSGNVATSHEPSESPGRARPLVTPKLGGGEPRAPDHSDRQDACPAGLLGLPGRLQAIRWLHFPDEREQAQAARQRLALDEFIELQLGIQSRRRRFEASARALPCAGDNRFIKPFLARLGFTLTSAQTAVLREMRKDLGGPHPMRRLLQGDVGSGKTVVAACAALMALESGFNVVLMAPTEILADQHFRTFTRWFEPLRLRVELQTGSAKTVEVGQSPPGPPPSATLMVGSHALLEPAFALPRLGLVIIDEQHKFGVAQRETLLRKGRYPHLLVMTATPIPRTLGLTLYGDLDLSVIREMPPGRGRIRTFVRGPDQLGKVHEFIREKIAAGRQAYVVCPRIEDSDLKTGMKAVKAEFARLQSEYAPHAVGLLHGRLPAWEKEEIMAAFRSNRLQILLATSVVEVGVDVANATLMIIENAENFGLAQLHQLRGRIGRGAHESYCILVIRRETPEARERLRALEETTDGFRIAEADLRLRGPGEFLGRDQSGLPPFRFADLIEDSALVEQARVLAARLLS